MIAGISTLMFGRRVSTPRSMPETRWASLPAATCLTWEEGSINPGVPIHGHGASSGSLTRLAPPKVVDEDEAAATWNMNKAPQLLKLGETRSRTLETFPFARQSVSQSVVGQHVQQKVSLLVCGRTTSGDSTGRQKMGVG